MLYIVDVVDRRGETREHPNKGLTSVGVEEAGVEVQVERLCGNGETQRGMTDHRIAVISRPSL